jgi:hypothetical protein
MKNMEQWQKRSYSQKIRIRSGKWQTTVNNFATNKSKIRKGTSSRLMAEKYKAAGI